MSVGKPPASRPRPVVRSRQGRRENGRGVFLHISNRLCALRLAERASACVTIGFSCCCFHHLSLHLTPYSPALACVRGRSGCGGVRSSQRQKHACARVWRFLRPRPAGSRSSRRRLLRSGMPRALFSDRRHRPSAGSSRVRVVCTRGREGDGVEVEGGGYSISLRKPVPGFLDVVSRSPSVFFKEGGRGPKKCCTTARQKPSVGGARGLRSHASVSRWCSGGEGVRVMGVSGNSAPPRAGRSSAAQPPCPNAALFSQWRAVHICRGATASRDFGLLCGVGRGTAAVVAAAGLDRSLGLPAWGAFSPFQTSGAARD